MIDDGSCSVEALVKQFVSDAIYIYTARKQVIGTKRNLACEAASGEIICHFDDDDWSAAGRIRDQVTRLLQSDKQMTGYHSISYWNGTKAYRYISAVQQYAVGTSMCYRKSFWDTHRFPPKAYAEDNALVYRATAEKQLVAVDADQLMVVMISWVLHKQRRTDERQDAWPEVPPGTLPPEFFDAIA